MKSLRQDRGSRSIDRLLMALHYSQVATERLRCGSCDGMRATGKIVRYFAASAALSALIRPGRTPRVAASQLLGVARVPKERP